MSELERIRKLAARARMERPPDVDVTDRVMRVLQAEAAQRPLTARPLAWVAATSLAIAIPVTVLALGAWETLTDPLLVAFAELPWGLL